MLPIASQLLKHMSSLAKGSNSSSQKPELYFQKESAVELSKS